MNILYIELYYKGCPINIGSSFLSTLTKRTFNASKRARYHGNEREEAIPPVQLVLKLIEKCRNGRRQNLRRWLD